MALKFLAQLAFSLLPEFPWASSSGGVPWRVDGMYILSLSGGQEVAFYGGADRLSFHAGGQRQRWEGTLCLTI